MASNLVSSQTLDTLLFHASQNVLGESLCSNPRYCNTDMNIIREKWEWGVVDPGFHFRGKIGSKINLKNID